MGKNSGDRASGVVDTPTFFINGHRYHGYHTHSAIWDALSTTHPI